MEEETDPKTAPFDAELEIIKLQGRFRWLVSELEEFRQKDRSLSARISRLKLKGLEEGEEEPEEEREENRWNLRREVENMSLEERAILFAKLSERDNP